MKKVKQIKKFIFDFLHLLDEIRKEKRRRDMSDSDDDDDPFHNKSTGFNATRNRLNATPSSTIRADSVAGRSRASTIKTNANPVNLSTSKGGNQTATPAGEPEFTENVGDVPEYQQRLKDVWQKRT